ncbi:MarR family winged helix-turn-helix transcriptional regulator [Polycladidibacter stylochi]|uniref:MarR family winged helix-turn-helix transcriptional regulator n=1 Tax=Polycladidibacter stylochi TaxID=1807766 RepID=UPI00082FBBEE|nr:MarR family transcriptional regulator [Pseudovibrio stylochi]
MVSDSLVWDKLKQIVTAVEADVAKEMQRKHNIGLSEFHALRFLAAAKNSELRMQQLADLIGLNQSSVTRLVSRLEANGFTIRDNCPKDKRGIYTILTDRGRKHYDTAFVDYENILSKSLRETKREYSNEEILGIVTLLTT